MLLVNRAKYAQHADLREELVSTGRCDIVGGPSTSWTFNGKAQKWTYWNGRIQMLIREECRLRGEEGDDRSLLAEIILRELEEYGGEDFTVIDAENVRDIWAHRGGGGGGGGRGGGRSHTAAVKAPSVQESRDPPAPVAPPASVAAASPPAEDGISRTFTVGGTDITAKAASYMKMKQLLKARGLDAGLVDSCNGIHALKLLGIKQGVVMAQELEE